MEEEATATIVVDFFLEEYVGSRCAEEKGILFLTLFSLSFPPSRRDPQRDQRYNSPTF
jgi:hypothetical protein